MSWISFFTSCFSFPIYKNSKNPLYIAYFYRFFVYANFMQMLCFCYALALHLYLVCYANAMQNYANRNRNQIKREIKLNTLSCID
nr:MAG TPA: hypothetical protein [Caudoviricetes sp.]